MNGARRESLRARTNGDSLWWDSVPVALERVAASSFCRGGGNRGWVATIDWFLQRQTMDLILEGRYDDGGAAQPPEPFDVRKLKFGDDS